jgi:hypothetical protein
MPTAMSYAIDTLLRLCEENTRLRLRLGEKTSSEVENIKLDVKEMDDEDKIWETLHNIPHKHICQYLAEEHSFHIYHKPPPTIEEMDKLKESADLIAESQQKQINLLLEDKRERMEDREKLLKQIKDYQIQLHQLSDAMLETKCQLKAATEARGVGRPKKVECSPCIGDPTP